MTKPAQRFPARAAALRMSLLRTCDELQHAPAPSPLDAAGELVAAGGCEQAGGALPVGEAHPLPRPILPGPEADEQCAGQVVRQTLQLLQVEAAALGGAFEQGCVD